MTFGDIAAFQVLRLPAYDAGPAGAVRCPEPFSRV